MKLKKTATVLLLIFAAAGAFSKQYSEKEAEELRNAVVAKVKTYIGCPYRSGATGPDAFDCSGLVYTVFREAAGIQLPRSARAIYSAVQIVESSRIENGDLVFFKTTGNGTISHVGIYIGRGQFIHAASDGANTGVIASSLTEKYYKNTFAAVGKVITTAGSKNDSKSASAQNSAQKKTAERQSSNQLSLSSAPRSSSQASNSSFASNIAIDTTLACDWNLWLPHTFTPNFRGIALTATARYTEWKIQPGIGTAFRWNYGCECFQIPVLFSMMFNEYIEAYLGAVFTAGTARMPGARTHIKGLIFPGTIGVSFKTPSVKTGAVRLSLSQDISYTFFTDKNGHMLNPADSLNAGLVFSTGIRVTLPLKNVLN